MGEKRKIIKEKETKIDKNIKKYIPFAIGIGVLAVIFIVLYLLGQIFQDTGKIEYKGLTFIREKYGEVIVYHYSYLTEMSDGTTKQINVLLRGNPKESKVPIEGKIIYPIGRAVYLSINQSGLENCEYDAVALGAYSMFLANNGFFIKAGTPNKDEAEEKNQSYVTCEKYPNNMVLSLRAANESKIALEGNLCYNLDINGCDTLPVMEKFIVQSILDAKESSDAKTS